MGKGIQSYNSTLISDVITVKTDAESARDISIIKANESAQSAQSAANSAINAASAANLQTAYANDERIYKLVLSEIARMFGFTNISSSNFEIVDEKGNVSSFVDSTGVFRSFVNNVVKLITTQINIGELIFLDNQDVNGTIDIVDTNGNSIFQLNKQGKISVGELVAKSLNVPSISLNYITLLQIFLGNSVLIQEANTSAFEVVDVIGNCCFQIGINGSNTTNSSTTKKTQDLTFADNIADFQHIIVYGQSLGAASFSGDVVSKTQKYNNLFRFIGGVRTYDANYLETNKRIFIERIGSPEYQELINYATKLTAREATVMQYRYSSIVGLTERQAYYEPIDANTYSFVKDGVIPTSNAVLMHHQDGETPITGCLEAINRRIKDENNVDVNTINDISFLASCAAYGSAVYNNLLPLDKGGTIQSNLPLSTSGDGSNMNYFEQLLADVYFAKQYFDSKGLTYSVPALLYYHESTNYGSAGIKFGQRQILQLFYLINQRVKAITGQLNDIIFVMHQSSLSQTQAQVELAIGIETTPTVYDNTVVQVSLGNKTEQQYITDTMPNADVPEYDKNKCILGQPIYPFEYASDFIHLSSRGSKMHGMSMGVALKAQLYNNRSTKWMPIRPVSHTLRNIVVDGVSYYELRLKFNCENAPLVFDLTAIHGTSANPDAVARGDKMGFIFANSTGVLQGFNSDSTPFISLIEVVRGNIIRILTKQNPAGFSIRYAYDYISHPSYPSKPRPWGNLRDSTGDLIQMDLSENNTIRVENWCPSFIYNL